MTTSTISTPSALSTPRRPLEALTARRAAVLAALRGRRSYRAQERALSLLSGDALQDGYAALRRG